MYCNSQRKKELENNRRDSTPIILIDVTVLLNKAR